MQNTAAGARDLMAVRETHQIRELEEIIQRYQEYCGPLPGFNSSQFPGVGPGVLDKKTKKKPKKQPKKRRFKKKQRTLRKKSK